MLDLPVRTERGAEDAGAVVAFDREQTAPQAAARPRGVGLAGRVLAITISFVFIAMALF